MSASPSPVVFAGLALPIIVKPPLVLLDVYPSRDDDGIRLGWTRRHCLRAPGSTVDVRRSLISEPPEPNI